MISLSVIAPLFLPRRVAFLPHRRAVSISTNIFTRHPPVPFHISTSVRKNGNNKRGGENEPEKAKADDDILKDADQEELKKHEVKERVDREIAEMVALMMEKVGALPFMKIMFPHVMREAKMLYFLYLKTAKDAQLDKNEEICVEEADGAVLKEELEKDDKEEDLLLMLEEFLAVSYMRGFNPHMRREAILSWFHYLKAAKYSELDNNEENGVEEEGGP